MRRILAAFLFMLLYVGVVALPAYATDTSSTYKTRPLNYYEKNLQRDTKLGGYDNVATSGPTVTAAKVINWLLTLLGAIAIALTVYAGMVWLLARGNDDEIKKAKDILAGSAIGLLIVLASYSITTYIFNSFVLITN